MVLLTRLLPHPLTTCLKKTGTLPPAVETVKLGPVTVAVGAEADVNHSMFCPVAVMVCVAFVPEFWQNGPVLAAANEGSPGLGVTFTVKIKLRGPSQVPINWLI